MGGGRRGAGWLIGRDDGRLAALARLHGLILLTDDQDFAPLADEIRLENWLRP